MTGHCRKTITKYLRGAKTIPEYRARPPVVGKLAPFKEYLEERMTAGVWNAQVLLRELRERGYSGRYTLLTDWLRPQRQSARTVAVRRFETAPGRQAQVDWGHFGTRESDGRSQSVWGFTPRLCRPYRPQTKGKVESSVRYVRRNFLCRLQGKEPAGLADLNAELRHWVWKVANQRVHGTTHEVVQERWQAEQAQLLRTDHRPSYPYVEDELRKVGRDAYVCWQGSRYSVPWQFVGRSVWVHERAGDVEVHYGAQKIAAHNKTLHGHRTITQPEHHRGIPTSARAERKILIHLQNMSPVVEVRSLAAYESAFGGDAQ